MSSNYNFVSCNQCSHVLLKHQYEEHYRARHAETGYFNSNDNAPRPETVSTAVAMEFARDAKKAAAELAKVNEEAAKRRVIDEVNRELAEWEKRHIK